MYRIVDVCSPDGDAEVASFECAWDALAALRREVSCSRERALGWRVLDPHGTVLVEPADVLDGA